MGASIGSPCSADASDVAPPVPPVINSIESVTEVEITEADITKNLEIGAGALIRQKIYEDPESLDV